MTDEPLWLSLARRLQAVAQTGLTYATDPFDVQRYESVRAIAAEMTAAGSDVALERIAGLFGEQAGYATPKIDVRVAIERNGALLFVREKSDGRWALPGGFADPGETPSAAAQREVLEEAGYRVRVTRLLMVLDRRTQGHPRFFFDIYKLFFAAELLGPAESTGDGLETDGVAFFARGEEPPLSLGRLLPQQVDRVWSLLERPDAPTEFD